MDQPTVIKLNHEYGGTSNLDLSKDVDDTVILLPLPIDIVNEAVRKTFSEFKSENESQLDIRFSNENKTNYQMVINLSNLQPRFPKLTFDEISDKVSNDINLRIQRNIVKLLKDNELDFKQYDRSRVFFEFSVANNVMVITWVKQFNFSKKDV